MVCTVNQFRGVTLLDVSKTMFFFSIRCRTIMTLNCSLPLWPWQSPRKIQQSNTCGEKMMKNHYWLKSIDIFFNISGPHRASFQHGNWLNLASFVLITKPGQRNDAVTKRKRVWGWNKFRITLICVIHFLPFCHKSKLHVLAIFFVSVIV